MKSGKSLTLEEQLNKYAIKADPIQGNYYPPTYIAVVNEDYFIQ